jgi:hypothetical protein
MLGRARTTSLALQTGKRWLKARRLRGACRSSGCPRGRNQTTRPEPLWHWLRLPLRYRLRWRTRASLETRQTSARPCFNKIACTGFIGSIFWPTLYWGRWDKSCPRPDFVLPAINMLTRADAGFAYGSGNQQLTRYEKSQFPACNRLTSQSMFLVHEAGNTQLTEKRTHRPLADDIQRPVA